MVGTKNTESLHHIPKPSPLLVPHLPKYTRVTLRMSPDYNELSSVQTWLSWVDLSTLCVVNSIQLTTWRSHGIIKMILRKNLISTVFGWVDFLEGKTDWPFGKRLVVVVAGYHLERSSHNRLSLPWGLLFYRRPFHGVSSTTETCSCP